ncbi:outer membrane porin L [compost metagenome]
MKGIYSITDNWLTTLRWRGGIQKDEADNVADKNYNQFNWEVGYRHEKFSITGDYEYKFTNYNDYKGDHDNWLYNVAVAVPINKKWVPYGEIGYVPRSNQDRTEDEMEKRYRLGIRYNFL